jgi:hypothetical protein
MRDQDDRGREAADTIPLSDTELAPASNGLENAISAASSLDPERRAVSLSLT